MTMPAPMLLPTSTTMRSLTPRPPPTARSPQADTDSSLAIHSGVRGVRACSSLMNGTSCQPRVGALRTNPCSRSIMPATPRPIPCISGDGVPAAFEDDADAVHLDGLAVLAQALLRELDGAEFLVLGEVEADLGRRVRARDIVEHLAQRPSVARDQLEQARGRVDAVIESEVAVAEEDVPAHLSREQRVFLLHLALDQRMPGLPHDGAAAVLLDVVIQCLRALDFADDGRTGAVGENVAREEDHELVAPEDAGLLVDGPDAIGIPIPGDADVGLAIRHLLLQIAQVRLDGGIGVMVRKRPVEIAEQLDDVVSERAQQTRPDQTARAVPGIAHDADRPDRHAQRLDHEVDVRDDDVVIALARAASAVAR